MLNSFWKDTVAKTLVTALCGDRKGSRLKKELENQVMGAESFVDKSLKRFNPYELENDDNDSKKWPGISGKVNNKRKKTGLQEYKNDINEDPFLLGMNGVDYVKKWKRNINSQNFTITKKRMFVSMRGLIGVFC